MGHFKAQSEAVPLPLPDVSPVPEVLHHMSSVPDVSNIPVVSHVPQVSQPLKESYVPEESKVPEESLLAPVFAPRVLRSPVPEPSYIPESPLKPETSPVPPVTEEAHLPQDSSPPQSLSPIQRYTPTSPDERIPSYRAVQPSKIPVPIFKSESPKVEKDPEPSVERIAEEPAHHQPLNETPRKLSMPNRPPIAAKPQSPMPSIRAASEPPAVPPQIPGGVQQFLSGGEHVSLPPVQPASTDSPMPELLSLKDRLKLFEKVS